MGVQRIVHRTGFIGAAISDASVILPVDQAFLEIVFASMDFSAGDYFYMTLEEDDLLEEVKVTDGTPTYLVIERSATPHPFSMAAVYNTDLTVAEVEERAAGMVPVAPINITGLGVATVNNMGGGNFTVEVLQPQISGTPPVEVTSSWPAYGISVDMNTGCCGDGSEEGAGAGSYIFIGSGIASVSVDGNEVTVAVPSPNFTGAGIAISGAWPNLHFAAAGVAGGTVTSVGVGAGLSYTGNPNVNPVLYISNTGVVAGDYGGIVVNARGQITSMPAGFNPVSAVLAENGLQMSRTDGTVTISGIDAAVGVKGVVALADADTPIDPEDETTAVTPKMLASVMSDLVTSEVVGGSTYAGEADADYTNTVATAPIALDLAAGEKAFIIAELTVRDATVGTIPQYAMAAFAATSAIRIQANKMMESNQQVMHFIINGPFSDGVLIKTTALGAASVVSHSAHAIIL